MNYLVTGDTHGHVVERIQMINKNIYKPEDTALIILGDAGINFYLNKTDVKNKLTIDNLEYTIYCVRGNHEERPENIPGMIIPYDENIKGCVYLEPNFPNIRYLMDGEIYQFGDHSALVIGGAYSVDKWYRLLKARPDAWCGWFKDEMLTPEEMDNISKTYDGKQVDFILSHTCPLSWEPRDLFLDGIDQSTIDKSMEIWLDDIKRKVNWKVWLFGHYHDDRLVRPGVEMMFRDIENIEHIWQRWTSGEDLSWWLKRDPNYDVIE